MFPNAQDRGSCKPCRESKSQCDQKKPRCTECITKNKMCGGYNMGNIFINVASTGSPPTWDRTQNAQKYLVLDLASQHQNSSALYPPSQSTSTPSSLPTGYTVPKAQSIDPNNTREMVNVFLNLYYRGFGAGKTPTDMLTAGNECGGWRLLLPCWIGKSTILDTAIGALATSFVGSQYRDKKLVDQGRNMYLQALQMTQQALHQPEWAACKELLATTLVMSSTELFLSNGGSQSQLVHIQGSTRLLGNAFQTRNFEQLHIYVLHQGLFEAISSRREYVFSAPSYRQSIRQMYTVPRTSRNDLFFQWSETILPLPNILHATDTAISSNTQTSTISSILDQLTALEHALTPWNERLRAQHPGPWTLPTAQPSTDTTVPFPLQFTSIESCTLYLLHWATQLLVSEAWQCLTARLPLSALTIHHHPSTTTSAQQQAEYASLVCRSVQFCTLGRSFAAMENMLFPLCVVGGFYARRGDGERMGWCRRAFGRIAEEQGIGFAVEALGLGVGIGG